jgi:very-short-patch-repair endonuclease
MFACSPFGPAGEFAASRHGALTRAQAADHGLTDKVIRRLIRDRVLAEPVPRVLVAVGAPATWRQRLYIATLASNGAGSAGGPAAAAMHAMDGCPPGPLELLVPDCRRIALAGLVIRQGSVDPVDLVVVDSIRCTGVARTLCDLATHAPPAQAKLAFEWAWRTGHSLAWIRQTAERLEHPRRRGAGRVLALVRQAEQLGSPTESALEVAVEEVLAMIPGIVRQHVVRTSSGAFVARVDFAIPQLKIAIEAHSREHHFGFDARVRDAERESALQAEGWIVRFITESQRRRPDSLRASLLSLVAARQRLLGCDSSRGRR